MSSLDDQLERWQAAGLIDGPTAGGIADFERGRTRLEPGGPSIAEAAVYLGVAVVVVGVVVLVGANWEEFRGGARIGVVGLPALLALLAGFGLRATGQQELDRGGSVAWLAAVALIALTAGVATNEAGWDEENTALAAVVAGAVSALGLWVLAPTDPQVLGVVASMGALSIGLGARTDDDQAATAGLIALALGVAAVASAELKRLTPVSSARLLSAALVAAGAYAVSVDDYGPAAMDLLVLMAGAGLIGLSILRAVFAYMAVGMAAVFVGLVTLIPQRIDDPTVAALALMVMGGALVASVIIVVKTRPWRMGRAAA